MKEFLIDLALPKTDRSVFIQWGIVVPFWVAVIVSTRKQPKDIRLFVYGLAMLNIAWFALRMVH